MVYTQLSFSLQNAVCFIILTCLVPALFTFYIQGVLKVKKKIIPAPKKVNTRRLYFKLSPSPLLFFPPSLKNKN